MLSQNGFKNMRSRTIKLNLLPISQSTNQKNNFIPNKTFNIL
jgi:hypothetical protein